MKQSFMTNNEKLNDAGLRAARRVAVFLVFSSVSVYVSNSEAFWTVDPVLRLFVGFGAAGLLFIIYVSALRIYSSRAPSKPSATSEGNTRSSDALVSNEMNGIFIGEPVAVPTIETRMTDFVTMRTFKVPRNFGMQTMVMAMLAFAILTAIMQTLRVPQVVSLVVIGFVCFVSAMQIFLNRVPRVGSSLAGLLIAIGLSVFYLDSLSIFFNFGMRFRINSIFLVSGCGLLGSIAGYLGGVLIAGIFLFADSIAEWWRLSATGEA